MTNKQKFGNITVFWESIEIVSLCAYNINNLIKIIGDKLPWY